jgi:hypothetical protein
VGAVVAVALMGCRRSPEPATIGSATAPAPLGSARSSAPSSGEQPSTGFHLVAEFPYPIALAPLGRDALVVAGSGGQQLLLSIESNRLRSRPELANVDVPTRSLSFVSAVGGTWPNDAWLALSISSDAGPSSSDVYKWSGSGWVKKHEHASGVTSLVPWRGNVAMPGTFFAVPVFVQQTLHELSGTGAKSLPTSICRASGSESLAPAVVRDGALSVFGYECGHNGAPPAAGMALLIETWSSDGAKAKQRLPLPADALPPERLLQDAKGLAALFPAEGKMPRHVARFVKGSWQKVVEVPADSTLLSSPNTLELWSVVGSSLRSWQGHDWTTTELPIQALPPNATWQSVWQRAAGDVWLIAATDDKSWLFNTADGKRATPIPNEAERSTLAASMSREPSDCARPFADVLALEPHQLGEDAAVTLSPAKARLLLRTVLAKNPRFCQLQFVRHDCYGEDCLGAIFSDAKEAEAFNSALITDGRPVTADIERLALLGNARCHAPPTSEPFEIARAPCR